MEEEVETQIVDYDTSPKIHLIPAATLLIDILDNFNLNSFYKREAHAGVKYSTLLPVSTVSQVMETVLVMRDLISGKTLLLISTNGDEDRNYRFDRSQAVLLWIVQEFDM